MELQYTRQGSLTGFTNTARLNYICILSLAIKQTSTIHKDTLVTLHTIGILYSEFTTLS